jgi:hypothetical protein
MVYAIMGGLAVATVLILVFLPALHVTWFRTKAPQSAVGETMDLPQTTISEAARKSGTCEMRLKHGLAMVVVSICSASADREVHLLARLSRDRGLSAVHRAGVR